MDRQSARLLDKRFAEEEADADRSAAFAGTFKEGPPPIPEAQLVYSQAKGVGVAVRGYPFVCNLPKGYSGPHLELAVIDRDRLIVTHPNHPPLLINPRDGTTSRL